MAYLIIIALLSRFAALEISPLSPNCNQSLESYIYYCRITCLRLAAQRNRCELEACSFTLGGLLGHV